MRIVLSTLLATLLFTALEAASPWNAIAIKFTPSVVFLEATTEAGAPVGFCSGFVINTAKKYVLTASHCEAEKILINGTPSVKLYVDKRKDLMVLRASDIEDRPAFALADKNPLVGDEVAAIGYGFALEKTMFRLSHVSITNLDIESLSGPFIMVDAGFLPGQSGGPVIDITGKLVAIVQRGNEGLGLGVGAEVIKDRVGRFFEEAPNK